MGVDGGVQKSATRQAAEWKEEIRGGGRILSRHVRQGSGSFCSRRRSGGANDRTGWGGFFHQKSCRIFALSAALRMVFPPRFFLLYIGVCIGAAPAGSCGAANGWAALRRGRGALGVGRAGLTRAEASVQDDAVGAESSGQAGQRGGFPAERLHFVIQFVLSMLFNTDIAHSGVVFAAFVVVGGFLLIAYAALLPPDDRACGGSLFGGSSPRGSGSPLPCSIFALGGRFLALPCFACLARFCVSGWAGFAACTYNWGNIFRCVGGGCLRGWC